MSALAATIDREDLLTRARRVIPGGASAGGRPLYGDVIDSAHGAYLYSPTGKRYIDRLLSYGPIVIGHTDEEVNAAVASTMSRVDLNWVGPQATRSSWPKRSSRSSRRRRRSS